VKFLLENWRKYLVENKAFHYHDFPPSSEVGKIISTNNDKVVASCKMGALGCQDVSYAWAKVFKDAGVSVEVHHGMYKGDGHTWLEVDGNIFDPTAAQFDDFPNMDSFEYETHEVEG